MAKRFTDTNKWRKPFIRGLQGAYKLFWLYLLDDCDHAGIWIVDMQVAQIRIGEEIDKATAMDLFGDKIVVFDNGERWHIPDFVSFQYGEVLNQSNRLHNSVINTLLKYNLINSNKDLTSPLQGVKDKDIYKDKDKEKEKEKKKPPPYKEFYRAEWDGSGGHALSSLYRHLIKYIMNIDQNIINEPGEHILKLKKQLTFEDFKKLHSYCEKRQTTIKDMINSWLNKPSYSTGRVSVYAVLRNWAGKSPMSGTNYQEPNVKLIETKIGKEK